MTAARLRAAIWALTVILTVIAWALAITEGFRMIATLRDFIQAAETDREPGDETPHVYNLRMGGDRRPGSILVWLAAVLLLGLAVAQGYVSYRAQYAFIDAAKHARLPSMLEALGLDTGAVIFALLGLAHARIGRPARIERALNIACALGSMTMNLLGADLASPRSVAVYVLPAVLYAACSDRLIATAAAAAAVPEASLWRFLGRGVLYGLRLAVAFPSTARGLRLRLLRATPLPSAEDPEGTELAAPVPAAEISTSPAELAPGLVPVPADAIEAAKASLRATIAAGNGLSQNQLQERFGLTRAQATKVRQAVAAESNGHPSE